MSKDIKIGNGLFRFESDKITLLFDKEKDGFFVGFVNAHKMGLEDLKTLNDLTSEMIKSIENEKH